MENSVNKFLKALGENTALVKDDLHGYFVRSSYGEARNKRWISHVDPAMLFELSLKEAVNLIVSLSESGEFYNKFPTEIQSPDYGDNWGRLANYIEINNRVIAYMDYGCSCRGTESAIKLLPAIPPSARSWANCVILSQIWENIYGDSYAKGPLEENSIYGIRLNAPYSDNIINYSIVDKISAEEQLKAFNGLAHFRGIKTGFRHVISADQIKIGTPEGDIAFDWGNYEHQELYIDECVKLVNLGFEAMFIDSAKHIGGYDMEQYTGVGALPGYGQMQYILNEIRRRSGKTTLSFVGEKSTDDFLHYRLMGLNAGTDYITGDNFFAVRELSEKLKYNRIYAPGVEVSNDNSVGGITYEQRLNRINTALFAFYCASDKLPSFMQMDDIFPLRYDTNTHHIMMTNPSYSTDGTPESHWEHLFASIDGQIYNAKVGDIFAHALEL